MSYVPGYGLLTILVGLSGKLNVGLHVIRVV